MTSPLQACRVLVTRPRDQAEGLLAMLAADGAAVLHRPTIEIVPATEKLVAAASPPEWWVFTSPNAVKHGLAHARALLGAPPRVAAVGPGTAAALKAAGCPVSVAPDAGGGAEALLAMPGFTPQPDQSVLIIRGEGGRESLQQALLAGGMRLTEWPVYRRLRPTGSLDIPATWLAQPLTATIVTSRAGLDNLLGMAGPSALEWVIRSQLVTVSERIAQAARKAGFADPFIAEGADDAALTRAVKSIRQERL